MFTLSDLRERYQKKSYENHTDSSLLKSFRKTSSKSIERFFIYEEILKRELPDDVIAKASGRNFGIELKDSEFILFSFKGGILSSGGFAGGTHGLIYGLIVVLPIFLWGGIHELWSSAGQGLLANALGTLLNIMTFFLVFMLVAFFTNSITSSKIILTNHRIGVRRTFFRIFFLQPKWLTLDQSVYINNLHQVHFWQIIKLYEISNIKKMLSRTLLWLTLIKNTENTSERLNFALVLNKSIFMFEALSLVVRKNGGQLYNIPFKIQHDESNLAFNYRFSHCEAGDLVNLLQLFSNKALPDFGGRTHFGMSNLARLIFYLRGDSNEKSKQCLPSFLRKGLLPEEFPLAILPAFYQPLLIPADLARSFKNYALLTNQGIIVFDMKRQTVTKTFLWAKVRITAKWLPGKVVFTSFNQEIFSALQELIDFPLDDVLDMAQSVNRKG